LHWVRQLPAAQPAWGKDQAKLQFDAAPQPVVMGKRLFVPSSANDSVTAYHTETGKELWRFHAEGPVRFAPVAWQGKVYFVSDDGYLYCVNAADGQLAWKVNGGPTERWLLGNHRLISSWPARGGPVLHQGKIFFTASIWPFMGVFIHAVNPDTGEIVWTNSGDGSNVTVHPHGAPAFGTVAPQGHLAASGNWLIVPGGRSTPAVYDTHTGKLKHFRFEHRMGGHHIVAAKSVYFMAGQSYLTADGAYLGWETPAVIEGNVLYSIGLDWLRAEKIKSIKQTTKKDRKGKPITTSKMVMQEIGEYTLKDNAGKVALKAGSRVYCGGDDAVTAYELSDDLADQDVLQPVWKADIDGDVHHLLAADNRLFAVTLDAKLYCFGPKETKAVHYPLTMQPLAKKQDAWTHKAKQILMQPGTKAGCCVALGVGTGRLIEELLLQSQLQIFVIDPDAGKVEKFRRHMEAAGLYGKRVSAHCGDPATFALPPYLANLIVAENPAALLQTGEESKDARSLALVQKMFATLRPYGGVACLELSADQHNEFKKCVKALAEKQSVLSRDKGLSLLSRPGPLSGAADWTHQYGDAAQTGVSKDKLVKAPLGLLWFGGPANDKVLPRHGHGPSPQVAGGRLFIEGPNSLRAMDVYTGRVLWEKELKDFGKYYNKLTHAPGAGEIGSNYVSLPDKVYAVRGNVILELDAATGEVTREFSIKKQAGKEPPSFGFIAVWQDVLVATVSPLAVDAPAKSKPASTGTKKKTKEDQGDRDDDTKSPDKGGGLSDPANPDSVASAVYAAGSKRLVVFDRHTGQLLWSRDAEFTFRHNGIAIGAGKVFCIDNITEEKKKALKRKGITFDGEPVLYALDARTGEVSWSTKENVFGTFLNYSEQHDLLLQAGSKYRDRAGDEVDKGMIAYRGKDGKILWENLKLTYGGPCLIWRDKILTNGLGGFAIDLQTGKPTGWKYNRQYGCNTALGSEFLLTFRSGCAGFYDLDLDSGTGNLGGFRSSCTNNLIVADGVLSAPDYTRTCTCAYQNQSSLALVHMPQAELWTYGGQPKAGQRGFNFAAAGDRRAPNGTLWQAAPGVAIKGTEKNAAKIKIEPEDPAIFRLHSGLVQGELPWVASSGYFGVKKITIPAEAKKKYTVKLVFLEPGSIAAGERPFDVLIQGKAVLENFDVVKAAGKARCSVVRSFTTQAVKGEIIIELQARGKLLPVISGIEVLEQ
jgi:outer membrane protein assembly factor BamB